MSLSFKLGRTRPKAYHPRLRLNNYLLKSLPPPPLTCDYTPLASSALSQMYGNDTLGDCVIAGIAHVVGVLTGNSDSNNPFIYTQDQIVALYSAIGGYILGDDSTDNGCDEETALAYWQQNGAPIGSHKIVGRLAVDSTNLEECQNALYLFENLVFAVELPNEWISPFPSAPGFIWDVAEDPDPNNGHSFISAGYDSSSFKIDSWGMLGNITNEAVAKYASASSNGQLFTVLSQDSIARASQKAPSGFDWSQLVADFDSLGGAV